MMKGQEGHLDESKGGFAYKCACHGVATASKEERVTERPLGDRE
jgi:hypothetical protein